MEIFNKNNIFINQKLKDKQEIFEFISQKALDMKITTNKKLVYDALMNREKEVSTGMEKGFAIPHCQSSAVSKPTLFYIKLASEIEWETFDNSKVQYVFSILIPEKNQNNIHLETLSKISTMLVNDLTIQKLKKSVSVDEILLIVQSYLNEKKQVEQMKKTRGKVVGITSCTVGIAHTYMAAEKLENQLKSMGYETKIETRGSVGVKNKLSKKDIDEADFVIIATDMTIDLHKFDNKKLLKTSTKAAIHNTEEIVKKAQIAPVYKNVSTKKEDSDSSSEKKGILKHIIGGISYMIPYVIFGGIMIALSLGLGKSIYGSSSSAPRGDFLWWIEQIGVVSFNLMIGVLGAYIAFSIAGRAALMPAFVVSTVANMNSLFFNIGGIESKTPLGFVGAILFGLLIGYTVKWISSFKIQKSISAAVPMFIIPIGVTLFYSLIVVFIIGAPVAFVMGKFISWLQSIFNTDSNVGLGVAFLVGALLGGMAGFDMGGPINKVAFLTSTALVSSKIFEPMGMVAAAIPVAPLGMGFATIIFRKKFTEQEKTLGASALFMGFIGISEGAIPFAVADPKRVITANVIGSSAAGAIAGLLSVTNAAAHGGPIVAILGAVGSKTHGTALGILFFFIAVVVGTTITTLIYGFWKGKETKSINIPFVNQLKNKLNLKKGAKNEKK
ncbi:PTS fructose transporter subunit IIABC [Mesomycoplasma lagogenitalium]|uniref:Fructose-specific PTS transporter subunit EIIC n=1 Tax=Mesomycoplasma lagogenitalium TaxID=171286 RepID=A0ABY8LUB2_9BACT|nr:fructose-specific PTS transporter subunit EIIC [Mesomycoplasma lagogenitalium]WGI36827.1 fructose-specific PTS transporter subunit EIIC [Mesomycoplasma lagogenitalium]